MMQCWTGRTDSARSWSGSVAHLGAICASTALLSGWTYPLFAHWVWGGGWLAQLAIVEGLGRGFLDSGGSSTIQVVGGLTALSIAWILGPRHGKFTAEGMPSAIPGHNSVLVSFGCFLALLGWTGLNSAGSLLFSDIGPGAAVRIAVNTALSAFAAGLMAAAITYVRFGKPDASLTVNGWVGGLAASSAACAFVVPAEAVVIGGIAGALVIFSVEWFELRLATGRSSGCCFGPRSRWALGGRIGRIFWHREPCGKYGPDWKLRPVACATCRYCYFDWFRAAANLCFELAPRTDFTRSVWPPKVSDREWISTNSAPVLTRIS